MLISIPVLLKGKIEVIIDTDDEIMTADEITQLLYDRDIVLLFNEKAPCEEHDKMVEDLQHMIDHQNINVTAAHLMNIPYEVKKYSLNLTDEKPYEKQSRPFTDNVLSLLKDIKNSDIHSKTIILDDGFFNLFTSMIDYRRLSSLIYYGSLTDDTALREFKTELDSSYIKSWGSSTRNARGLGYLTREVKQFEELVSAILTCGHIHTITYHPKNKCMLAAWQRNNKGRNVEDYDPEWDDFGSKMFKNGVVEDFLKQHTGSRVMTDKDIRVSISLNEVDTYLHHNSDLFIDPYILRRILKRVLPKE